MPAFVFRFGAPVTAGNQQVGTLAGLLLGADGHRWEGLMVCRGPLRRRYKALRRPRIVQATEDEVLLAGPSSEEDLAPAERVVRASTPIRAQDGAVCGHVDRVIGSADGQLLQVVLHRTTHPRRVVLPATAISLVHANGLVCNLAPEAASQLSPYRSDAELEAAVRQALDEVQGVPQLEHGQFRVAAEAGAVTLSGHVSTRLRAEAMVAAAAAVPGVQRVDNRLVDDFSLQCAAAAALARDPRARGWTPYVAVQHGFVHLGGNAPDAASATAAGEVVGQLAGVRGVINRISAPEFTPDTAPVLQPTIAAGVVSADHEEVGRVERVVLDRHTRRLVGVVVACRSRVADDGTGGSKQVLVPATAIVDVTPVLVRLRLSAGELSGAPAAARCTSAPVAGWQPPFPYATEDCLWPVEPALTS